MYHITHFAPPPDPGASAWSFSIKLWPQWRDMVTNSKITQEHAQNWLNGQGEDFRIRMGYVEEYYKHQIRIRWGEWGIHNVSVPGNACGLDIDDGFGSPIDGRILQPHNVDTQQQATLLLMIFLRFAENIVSDWELKQLESKLHR